MLERFASEGKVLVEDTSKRRLRAEEPRVASFASGPHPVEIHPAAKAQPAATIKQPEPAAPDAATDDDGGGIVDSRQLADYGGFVLHSIGRHRLLAAAAFTLVLSTIVGLTLLMPKTYYVEVRLFAQRNAVMTALSNPGRAVPWDADAPTRAAAETVLRRDNLISLITQTSLIEHWDRTRAPIVRLKDWLTSTLLRHEPTADEKLDRLVGRLERQMIVTAGAVGDGTVSIELYWPDAEMAYRLVEKAQQAFLDARQVAETTAITESIAILERYSASLHDNINRTLTELERTQPRRTAMSGPRPTATAATAARRASAITALESRAEAAGTTFNSPFEPDSRLAELKAQVNAKRQEVDRIEEARQRQLAELQSKLAALTTMYTRDHPSVISLQQNIAAFQYESPQIVALRNELEELETEYDERSAADAERLIQAELARRTPGTATTATPAASPELPAPATASVAPVTPVGGQTTDFSGLVLKTELNQLQSILERTDGARIELAVSQAAFKYRYSVIRPAQLPREPVAPNLQLIFLAGFIGSLVLAVGLVVGKDLLTNRILEPWQVERQLGVPILGTTSL
jgi:uncharacterized protein involved in exopolysaccharide biosynthesis